MIIEIDCVMQGLMLESSSSALRSIVIPYTYHVINLALHRMPLHRENLYGYFIVAIGGDSELIASIRGPSRADILYTTIYAGILQ